MLYLHKEEKKNIAGKSEHINKKKQKKKTLWKNYKRMN